MGCESVFRPRRGDARRRDRRLGREGLVRLHPPHVVAPGHGGPRPEQRHAEACRPTTPTAFRSRTRRSLNSLERRRRACRRGRRARRQDQAPVAWRGPDYIEDEETDTAGVGWILAENWWPYQRPTFVTPPFAGYVSGHSTYSRAAAEVLTALTGDAYFPGGMSGFEIKANEFLVFEDGPVRRHDVAVGHVSRRVRSVQPVAHLGRHSSPDRRYSRPLDGHRDWSRRVRASRCALPGEMETVTE